MSAAILQTQHSQAGHMFDDRNLNNIAALSWAITPCLRLLLLYLQLGFFSIVGIPMFKAIVDLFPDAQPMLDGVLANYNHWEAATPDADLPA